MTDHNQSLVVASTNFEALTSNHYKSMPNGIQFEVDESGKIVPITREELQVLVSDLKITLSDTERVRERTKSFDNWAVGDTGGALKFLYGDSAVTDFAEQIDMPIEQVNKWISVSKAFGFPNRIKEMRHSDPDVSHAHHQKVQGFKDLTQRMNLLQEASNEKLSAAAFYERIKQLKAGPGADPTNPTGNEFGVFRPSFRVYDPRVDNPEQFLTEFFNKTKEVYFPEYLDPVKRAAREEYDRREKMADKLPSELKQKVLLEQGSLPLLEFEKLVNVLAAQSGEQKKIEKELSKIKDDGLRTQVEEKIKTENLNLEAAKSAIVKAKDEAKLLKRDAEKIDKLIDKIKDEAKCTEIKETAAREKLLLTQVEAIVNPIIADELIAEESKRLTKEFEEKKNTKLQERADAIRRKQLEPKEKKEAKTSTAELPLGKKEVKGTAVPKKKSTAKSKKQEATSEV